MDLQDKARDILARTLMNEIGCKRKQAEAIAGKLVESLEENHFFIQHDWQSDPECEM